jgi:hypothetical protein
VELIEKLLLVDQVLLERPLLFRMHRRQAQVAQRRIGQRRQIRQRLQELLLEPFVLVRLSLSLLLLQVPDLLLLEKLELHPGARRNRNRNEKADKEQPLQHSRHHAGGKSASPGCGDDCSRYQAARSRRNRSRAAAPSR